MAPQPVPTQPGTTGKSLHDMAVDAAASLRTLAAGMAHAGVAPDQVQPLLHFADGIDQIIKVLSVSPNVEEAAKSGVNPQPPGPPPGPVGPPQPPMGRPGPFAGPTQALHAQTQRPA